MKKFESELAAMEQRLVKMAEETQTMLRLATTAIKHRERDLTDDVRAIEKRLNAAQSEIDQEAVRMMTVYGPVAGNLRYLLGCTHVTAQLERIGDQITNICESLRMMTSDPLLHPTHETLQRMADAVMDVVNDSIDAYLRRDTAKAEATRQKDDLVDALNDQVVKELLTDQVLKNIIAGVEDLADQIAHVLLARHLERIADQATNICKEVIYMVRGDYVRHRRIQPPDEQSS